MDLCLRRNRCGRYSASYRHFMPRLWCRSHPGYGGSSAGIIRPISTPPCSESQSPSLSNGLALFRSWRTGLSVLTIDNGTGQDADVKLVSAGRVLSWTYSRARQQHTIANVPVGNYRLMFCQGSGWNIGIGRFTCNRACFELNKTLEFNETPLADGVEYSQHTVTLHEVLNGNVTKSGLSTSAFDSVNLDQLDSH